MATSPRCHRPGRATTTMAYQPALDGLRASCLIAVLLFHSGFSWMAGGYLGVSTFFTLSGYLITTLLLVQWEATGVVAFAGFWQRRLRRLMPAALVGISLVLLFSPWWLDTAARERLTGDALAALVYAINWRFVREDYVYEAIFVAPSPLQHFWSLAIEAQFYLFFPLLVGLLARLGGTGRTFFGSLLGLAVLSVGIAFTIPLSDEGRARIYYGSDTRFAEILFGALLAVLLRAFRPGDSPRADRVVSILAPAGLVTLLASWVFVGLETRAPYRGGFALYAAASTAVIAGAVAPGGPVRGILSPRWLQWIGRISYGAYVYHWPVFLLLDETATGLSAPLLLAARTAVTLVAADVSYRWIERPIRVRGREGSGVFGWLVAPLVAGCAALALFGGPAPARQSLASVFGGRPAVDVSGSPPGGLRLALFGDSTAFSLRYGLEEWTKTRSDIQFVFDGSRFSCGIIESGEHSTWSGWGPVRETCKGLAGIWRDAVREHDVDVALVLTGTWDVRKRAFGTPAFEHMYVESLRARMDALVSSGAKVVWLTTPHFGVAPKVPKRARAREALAADPKRVDRLTELLRSEAEAYPGVQIVDLAGFVKRWPGGENDLELRFDTLHFAKEGSVMVVNQWLGDRILEAAR